MNTWQRLFSPDLKKARLVLVGLILLAVIIFAAFYWWGPSQNRHPLNIEGLAHASRAEQLKALQQDTDDDGLKDWEETIFHTDPNTVDSDADGTGDGEEVKNGRDPLKPGPDDGIASTTAQEISEDFADAPPNLTERIAHVLGQRYLAQRVLDPNATLDPKAISEQIAKEIPTYTPTSLALTIKDLTVINDNSEDAIRKWANQFDATVQDSLHGLGQAEPLILTAAFQSDNYAVLAQLDKYRSAYEQVINRIKKVPVPSEFASYQLDYIRIVSQFKELVPFFRNAEEDPVAALAGLEPYFDLAKALQDLNQRLQQHLVRRGITFS